MISRCISSLAVGLVLAVLASCASGPKSGLPCDDCTYGVADQKASPPRVFCVVDGKETDCRKNPPECPECAKHKK